jgi:hypothetical protein
MYLTRKGAPVRLVYPFSTALTVGDFHFQPRSMIEVSFITSELKTQAQTQMRVRRESVLTNLNTKAAVVRLRQCPLGEGECKKWQSGNWYHCIRRRRTCTCKSQLYHQ